ncbi:MAG: C40 family peptidase [Clostridiales bacterium]|jgi:cell wall-associated NlpC family hydrolase|nr:C40 family peptidase [Clostridiales bacterium]
MDKNNNMQLVEYVKSKIGVPYLYGAKMETITRDKFDMLKKLYGRLVWDTDAAKIGKVCVDCSGLISSFTGVVRGSSQFKEAAKQVNPINTIASAPVGALVWMQGHIGVYIGNGEYIAADGSAYGTRKGKLPNKFTHWFLCSDIEYKSALESPAASARAGGASA